MTRRTCQAIIVAAGQGTRMKSDQPKVLHQIAGLSMIGHVTKAASEAGVDLISVVVGPDMEAVQRAATAIHPAVNAHIQTDRLGTAHAVLAARADLIDPKDDVLVLFGDTPLLTSDTLKSVRDSIAEGHDVVVLGFRSDVPDPYGRLIEQDGKLVAIREAKDCTPEEFAISFCNAGIMGFSGKHVLELLDAIDDDNAQKEYYLTDAVEKALAKGLGATAVEADEDELQGVNNRQHLANVEAAFQRRARDAAMTAGATLVAPETVYFAYDTKLGRDVLIEPNVIFAPGVTIADHVTIRAFSYVESTKVADGCVIGPYARLRPGTVLEEGAKVGNFVEIKKARIEKGAKVNHLSYIGDARVGEKANIGAGTITCNYDGFDKFKTDIGKGAFIGSNTALVAPATIGDGAIIGAGSTITDPVEADDLAFTRARPTVKSGWAASFRQKKAAKKKH
ncbi:bifunctional UDP-N-acetylglucosamine pyrophosphorylase / Glucosamine-1-phosphate N-acetyltransferase [Cohaesibacter sp. ES.047]|uniref:bifunctional UDP-N-acetylglucosamine diphosphorylase/glucosamine-1-phosphate N-acetyltransferase GlmU n=1 Tax=Cohaesibacter sp. ES.047 TaxID=1798205 RepID=UPI000BB99E11|nr:bifunctional UDP-N-acetylglucosamine diphosphorylase/glucosamine-1-phosphate N-acetyltransferase GlmU [Cohaesibacter sp. ES.047]SNY93319.1 bifunctional UDP-N-acetylglucosamine pyrophosphorylase / Glucosamine-1-phosphate N-acetyltransferase [Cohaesibacter sp. ES.047]